MSSSDAEQIKIYKELMEYATKYWQYLTKFRYSGSKYYATSKSEKNIDKVINYIK